jgi:hypothetical protein
MESVPAAVDIQAFDEILNRQEEALWQYARQS